MNSVRRTFIFLRSYALPATGAAFALLLVNAGNLITPQLLRMLIDQGITPLNLNRVYLVAGGLVGVAIVRGAFNFLQSYWTEIASQGVAYELRNRIFEKLQNLSFSYHDRAQTGKLMTRMTSDVEIVRMFVGQGFLMLVSAFVLLIGTLVIMYWMNWLLALVISAAIPVIGVLMVIFIRRIMPASRSVQRKLGGLNTILQENLAGMRVVKAFARESFERERYLAQNRELLNENINLVKLFSSVFPLVFFIANMGVVAVVWIGGNQVIGGAITLGELVAFNGYLMFLLMPMFMLGMIGASLSRAEASSERIFEVIDARSEIVERADATPLSVVHGRVTFEDVCFRYIGGESNVLDGVSFTAEPGMTVAILGKTGAGKSTIINLIPRFYDVTDGRVTIDGIDVRDVTIESLRQNIGIVLQETTLFSGTIRDNIAYGRPEAPLENVIQAAKAAQADEFIEVLPEGYDTLIGERGIGLSGGQRQRIAIARALLVDPQILIMDDSTSAVDAETEYQIQQALDGLMKGRTSFVIAQRISTVRNADMILLLEDGKLADRGRHEELMRTSELYAEILETQFGDRAELMSAVDEQLPVRGD